MDALEEAPDPSHYTQTKTMKPPCSAAGRVRLYAANTKQQTGVLRLP